MIGIILVITSLNTTLECLTSFNLSVLCHDTLPAEWSNQDVVEKYLKPINMEHMAKVFMENNINGAVLLALEVSGGWREMYSLAENFHSKHNLL